jgi:Kef-type K+ transport system membrane component KefB
MLDSAFTQIALILLVALAVGFLARLAKQPLIIAYIFVGVLLGPAALNLVSSGQEIALLAKLGIAILLFLVGLKLDLGLIKTTGLVALYTGLGQVLATAVLGYLLVVLLGFEPVAAVYIAIAICFSSTIVIVKMFSDRRELDQLHGQIAVGVLIVQDILVIIAMIAIAAIGAPGSEASTDLFLLLLGSAGFLLVTALLAKYVIPRLLDWVARSPELTLLFGVSWAVSLAAISAALGLSMEIGAFVAGVTLAATPYRENLSSRMVSLRDVMLLFFFIQLGISLEFSAASSQLGVAFLISAFVMAFKPLAVLVIMGLLGYSSRVSFKTGIALAQISEFSLILVALGYSLGQVSQEVLSLVTLVAVITITLSTYLISYSDALFARLSGLLTGFQRSGHGARVDEENQEVRFDAIVIGAGRLGGAVVTGLLERGANLLVVDQNPDTLRSMRESGVATLFGDVADSEFAASLPLHEADSVICTVPEKSTNLLILEILERYDFEGNICLTAMDSATAKILEGNERVSVIKPLLNAADQVVSRLPNLRDRG